MIPYVCSTEYSQEIIYSPFTILQKDTNLSHCIQNHVQDFMIVFASRDFHLFNLPSNSPHSVKDECPFESLNVAIETCSTALS